MSLTVEVTRSVVEVTRDASGAVEVVEVVTSPVTVEVAQAGPQGPAGPPGSGGGLDLSTDEGQLLREGEDGGVLLTEDDLPEGSGGGGDGASAYEVAVANGFSGTEEEWLASLVGPAGADGAAGADGEPGAKGDDGEQGPQGPQGEQGPAGADGAAGAAGAKGDKGDKGDVGDTGPAGPSTPSTDSGNLLTVGTDSLLMLDPDDLPDGGGPAFGYGSGAPSGGSDGDWKKRTDTPTNLYHRESGSWVQRVGLSGLLDLSAVQGKSYLTIGSQAVALNSGVTVGEMFNIATTGASKSSNDVTASNADACGGYTGSNGCGGKFTLTTLPGSGQTASFGVGAHTGSPSMLYDVPFVQVNNSGVAVLKFFLYTFKTFTGTVSGSTNNVFNIRVMPGAALVAQMNGNTLVDFCFLPSNFLTRANFDAYTVGPAVAGYGVVKVENVEWYL